MQKIVSTILGALLFVSFASPASAALVICMPPPALVSGLSADASKQQYAECQKQQQEIKDEQENKTEENKTYQETEPTSTPLLEQQEVEKVSSESDIQAKIKELEDRIKSLESQKTSAITTPPQTNSKSTTTVVSPVKVPSQTSKAAIKQEESQVSEQVNLNATSSSAAIMPQITPKKVDWFTRIINWFLGR